jgi:uncharacterized membrane protein YphA (DoxX/SURF4 family)
LNSDGKGPPVPAKANVSMTASPPGSDRTISPLACVLLVTLRLFIGWHLFYEGLWKIQTQATSQPWSAEGYLKTAIGPLRNQFRDLTGDPWDYRWLDYDQMTTRWDDWANRFLQHYPGAAESVGPQLMALLNGPKDFRVALESLPAGVELSRWEKAIRFDAAAKRLIVSGEAHLLPDERDAILALAPEPDAGTSEAAAAEIRAFRKAVTDLYALQSKLSYKKQLAAILKGDPERVGVLLKDKSGAVLEERIGDIGLYRAQVERYIASEKAAKTKFQWDHVDRQWRELQELRRKCIGPVQALELKLKQAAEAMLTPAQLSAGPVPEPWTQVRQINFRTMWGLAIVGVLLIAGCFTRIAALGGFALLMLFYLAVPPWPGVPEIPGPEHNYIVNKVLVEAFACLALAALPTGQWFGVDAIGAALWKRFRGRA